MFTVGAITDRPYKQISAEMLFSLPICDIMEYIVGWGLAPAVKKDLANMAAGVNSRPTKGYGHSPKPFVIQMRNWR